MPAAKSISRRHFLRSAGGVTFLALVPVGSGLFAVPASVGSRALPLFTVLPYIQPGPEQPAERWPRIDGHCVADYAGPPTSRRGSARRPSSASAAVITHVARVAGQGGETERDSPRPPSSTGLALATQVRLPRPRNGQTLAEGFFTTRKPRGHQIRFVAFGDNSYGEIGDRAIASAYQPNPDFVMNTGDNVYESGSDNEYQRYFFPVYNADSQIRGWCPALRSVPFYSIIANHDVQERRDGPPVADFIRSGRPSPSSPLFICRLTVRRRPNADANVGSGARGGLPGAPVAAFRAWLPTPSTTGTRTSSAWTPTPMWTRRRDLTRLLSTTLSGGRHARWKFVVYHHPAFNVGDEHYAEQHMRVLTPVFEPTVSTLY